VTPNRAIVILLFGCFIFTSTISSTGCGDDGSPNPYDDVEWWLCHPDKVDDQCTTNDLTATELHPDGTTTVVPHQVAENPAFDCFYVYPTVDIFGEVGNVKDPLDTEAPMEPLLSQAARFTSMCRMFAPLYHQITLTTFSDVDVDTYLEVAYADVDQAFSHYLDRHAGDRNFVIMGHSQGTRMTTMLLQRVIEPDPGLTARLIVALLIGGTVDVQDGALTGGTFAHLPLCTSETETGCVITFRSYADGYPPPQREDPNVGRTDGCVDPSLLRNLTWYSGTYFPTSARHPAFDVNIDFGVTVDTPYILVRDLYSGECRADANGDEYLSVAYDPAPSDTRINGVNFDHWLLSPDPLGLHILDYSFPLGDMLALVETKAAAMAP
jgi:hypothetical protein